MMELYLKPDVDVESLKKYNLELDDQGKAGSVYRTYFDASKSIRLIYDPDKETCSLMYKYFEGDSAFDQGIRELMQISYSIRDCIQPENTEIPKAYTPQFVLEQLFQNLEWSYLNNRKIHLHIFDRRVTYKSSGGLEFGWERDNAEVTFFVEHPFFCNATPENSTLYKALSDNGYDMTEGYINYHWITKFS